MAGVRQWREGGGAICGCSGSDGGVLPSNLAVENHGQDHPENQQDGDGEGDSQHHLHVFLHQRDDLGGAGRGVGGGGGAGRLGGVAAARVGNFSPVRRSVYEAAALELRLQLLQVVPHGLWLWGQRCELGESLLHPLLHPLLLHGSQDAERQQEDEDEEEADEEYEQHEAVLPDGSTAAQEAEHHDDHPDGDHQVDARNRFIGDLEGVWLLLL